MVEFYIAMRLELIEKELRVMISEWEFENLVLDEAEKMGDERLELVLRLMGRSSPRRGKALELTPNDFFIPEIEDVEIPFVVLEGTKHTSGKDTVVDGDVRVSWVPKDLYDDIMDYVERENIQDDEEIIDVGGDRIGQLIRDLRSRLAKRTGRPGWEHLKSHDLRAFFCTNLIRNYRVSKPLVMEMGGWENEESMDPYLAVPTLKEIQDELCQTGVVEQDVPTPPQREDLEYVTDYIEELQAEIERLRRDLELDEMQDVADVSLDEIEDIKKEALRRKKEETPTDTKLDQFMPDSGSIKAVYPLAPVVWWAMKASEMTVGRLEKEWRAISPPRAEWPSSQKSIRGATLYAGMLVVVGILFASMGLSFNPFTMGTTTPPAATAALGTGSTAGIIQVLWSDYQNRIEDVSLCEWVKRKLG